MLKETIAELEDKLVTSREINNRDFTSEIAKFHGQSLGERELLAKKNEEISRLNDVIKVNRGKVTEAYNEISNEKIKNIKAIEQVQQKYDSLIALKNKEIEQLKCELQKKDS